MVCASRVLRSFILPMYGEASFFVSQNLSEYKNFSDLLILEDVLEEMFMLWGYLLQAVNV